MVTKKILLVMSKFPPEYSGPGIRLPKLYDTIADQIDASEVGILCNSIEFPENTDYIYNGYKVKRIVCEYIRKRKFPYNLLPKKLYNFILNNAEIIKSYYVLNKFYKDVDLVHIVGHSGATAAAIAWANKNNKPAILEMVNSEAQPYQKFMHIFKLQLHSYRSCIINFTNEARDKCITAGYKDNIWTRPNPIDELRFNIDFDNKYKYRCENTPFKETDIVICSVAKIIPRKNQILLVDVLRLLPDKYKLIIAGPLVSDGVLRNRDSEYFHRIVSKIEEYGLSSRVHIVSEAVDSATYMKLSDIYTMPAVNEGFGTPMLEAIACGIPVIANKDEPSFFEWVEDGVNGYLADIQDIESWARSIEDAAKLLPEQMKEQSSKVIAMAGQKNLYKKYINIINERTI